MKDWLDSLKPGDEVAVTFGYTSAHGIATVDRTTPTQVIVGRARFRRSDGYRVGDSGAWSRASIRPVTDAIRESATRAKLIAAIVGTSWKSLSTDQLRRITDIVNEGEKP